MHAPSRQGANRSDGKVYHEDVQGSMGGAGAEFKHQD
jgi:hypothetical protein